MVERSFIDWNKDSQAFEPVAGFEEAQERSAEFELILSGQAFHWIQKEIGMRRLFGHWNPVEF
jgi:hypothetical protein